MKVKTLQTYLNALIINLCLGVLLTSCMDNEDLSKKDFVRHEAAPASQNLSTQFIVGHPVGNLNYRLDSGEVRATSSDGKILCWGGERVQLFIGDLDLGNVICGEIVTYPNTITGEGPDLSNAIVSQHIALLLFSLDNDAIPENGIIIPEGTKSLVRSIDVQNSSDTQIFNYINQIRNAASSIVSVPQAPFPNVASYQAALVSMAEKIQNSIRTYDLLNLSDKSVIEVDDENTRFQFSSEENFWSTFYTLPLMDLSTFCRMKLSFNPQTQVARKSLDVAYVEAQGRDPQLECPDSFNNPHERKFQYINGRLQIDEAQNNFESGYLEFCADDNIDLVCDDSV